MRRLLATIGLGLALLAVPGAPTGAAAAGRPLAPAAVAAPDALLDAQYRDYRAPPRAYRGPPPRAYRYAPPRRAYRRPPPRRYYAPPRAYRGPPPGYARPARPYYYR